MSESRVLLLFQERSIELERDTDTQNENTVLVHTYVLPSPGQTDRDKQTSLAGEVRGQKSKLVVVEREILHLTRTIETAQEAVSPLTGNGVTCM